ncbi:TPA: Arc family DNA-binding protein [Pseudomonas aeruginosa]
MTTKRNPQFNVRISPELKEKIVALAEKNKRPINAEINAALEAWVEVFKNYENENILKEKYGFTNNFNKCIEKKEDIKRKIDVTYIYDKYDKYDDIDHSHFNEKIKEDVKEYIKEYIKKDILSELLNKIEEVFEKQKSEKYFKKL